MTIRSSWTRFREYLSNKRGITRPASMDDIPLMSPDFLHDAPPLSESELYYLVSEACGCPGMNLDMIIHSGSIVLALFPHENLGIPHSAGMLSVLLHDGEKYHLTECKEAGFRFYYDDQIFEYDSPPRWDFKLKGEYAENVNSESALGAVFLIKSLHSVAEAANSALKDIWTQENREFWISRQKEWEAALEAEDRREVVVRYSQVAEKAGYEIKDGDIILEGISSLGISNQGQVGISPNGGRINLFRVCKGMMDLEELTPDNDKRDTIIPTDFEDEDHLKYFIEKVFNLMGVEGIKGRVHFLHFDVSNYNYIGQTEME